MIDEDVIGWRIFGRLGEIGFNPAESWHVCCWAYLPEVIEEGPIEGDKHPIHEPPEIDIGTSLQTEKENRRS